MANCMPMPLTGGFLDEQERKIETLKCCVGLWKTSGKKGQKEQKRLGIRIGRGVAQG